MRDERGASGKLSRLMWTLSLLTGWGGLASVPAAEPDVRPRKSLDVRQSAVKLVGNEHRTTPAPRLAQAGVQLRVLSRYRHGTFGKSAAEISAYDSASRRLFVVNAEAAAIDILDLSKPSRPRLARRVSLSSYGKPNSVAAHAGRIAVAVSAEPQQDPGHLVWLDAEGSSAR